MIMKRVAQPPLSPVGELVLNHYEQRLRVEEDLSATTIRNYLSDLRQFASWYEEGRQQGREETASFTVEIVTTPTITDYRTYLQLVLQLKPNSVNRSLISLKRYFAWLVATEQLKYDPAKVVKMVGEEATPFRYRFFWRHLV
jgi:site-specific recombinase XerD